MGFWCAILITTLALFPFFGGLVIALIAPSLLASAYLAVDMVSRLKMPLPASLRLAAVKKSLTEPISIFRVESRVLPAVLVSLYGILVAVLANILMQLVAGDAWASHWMSLSGMAFLGVFSAALLGFLVYILLALSLIYAMPLAFLQNESLILSIRRSFEAGAHHLFALIVIFAPLLIPPLLGTIVSYFSIWAAYLLVLALSAIALPIAVTSLYCSYRNLFPVHASPH